MIYFRLFLAFLKIGAFSFGGGYAAMPLIQAEVVNRYQWLSLSEFTDLVTISQMTPGPIAVNAASFVGNLIGGIPGAIAATIGCCLPSCLFVTLLAWLYARYRKLSLMQGILRILRPAVVAMILGAGLSILVPAVLPAGWAMHSLQDVEWRALFWFLLALFLLRRTKLDPVLVMVLTGMLELLYRWIFM